MTCKYLLPFCLVVLLCGCDTQKTLIKNGRGKAKDYEIGQFTSGCCGCFAMYYSLFAEKKLKYQLIYEMSCGFGQPTLFTFTHNEKGAPEIVNQFVAVADSTAEVFFMIKKKCCSKNWTVFY